MDEWFRMDFRDREALSELAQWHEAYRTSVALQVALFPHADGDSAEGREFREGILGRLREVLEPPADEDEKPERLRQAEIDRNRRKLREDLARRYG